MKVRNLGNRLSYTLSGGWSAANTQFLNTTIPWIIDKLLELAGPSFTDGTVDIHFVPGKLGGVKIFNAQDPTNPQIDLGAHYSLKLLAHELYHAWICPYNLGVDEDLNWTEALAAFEESMAHAAAEVIEIKYKEEVDPDYRLSINRSTAIYDLRNKENLTSVSFWADQNGMSKAITKYEMGATAIRKILVVKPNFYIEFLEELAEEINTNPDFAYSRELISNLMERVDTGVII